MLLSVIWNVTQPGNFSAMTEKIKNKLRLFIFKAIAEGLDMV